MSFNPHAALFYAILLTAAVAVTPWFLVVAATLLAADVVFGTLERRP